MAMKSLTVYFSQYGNTRKVAEAIAEGLSAGGQARVIPMHQLMDSGFDGVDLLVMGTPTHRMKLPEAVQAVFDNLDKRMLRGTAVAAFDTSYRMSPFLARMTAAKKLAKRLRKLGGTPVVAPETFHVVEKEGPLYDGEVERARAWAESIRERLDGRGNR
jgi:flavodoxin